MRGRPQVRISSRPSLSGSRNECPNDTSLTQLLVEQVTSEQSDDLPSGPTSMASAAGTLGSPGMVMISPQIATTNSAPAESRTSRTLIV